ncbi:MAG: hypothetical protein HZB61_13635 [Nitrospirae bacterium]|nr:hypothetical protein [Nitrospirota bacterium]
MKSPKILTIILIISCVTVFYACATGRYMGTGPATTEEIQGTYTLLLHGNRYSDDVENVAVLDKEGDRYTFEIYAPEYDYTVKKGLPAKEALEEAERFVRFNSAFMRSRLSRIVDNEGNTIGYELRPLYHLFEFGQSDVLYINYLLRDNRVLTIIRQKEYSRDREPSLFRDSMDR